MKIIEMILKGVDKAQDIVKIVKALLAGVDAFTKSLQDSKVDECEIITE
ncbi:hypothetical protein [Paludibacter sp. 221]|nr:hypothetical protein [Paludibacter sp. 221]